MFCSACGVNNEVSAKFCQSCGAAMVAAAAAATPPLPYDAGTMRGATPVQTAAPRTATGKNPVVAAILSALVVGVGQFYNGDVKKGAAMLIGAVLLGVATGGLLWLALAIWSAVDAYQVANGAGKMR